MEQYKSVDRIDNRSDGSTDLPTADFDDDGQFGFATRTDGLDIESDGQQYCLIGAVLHHDAAVGFTRTESLAGPALAVLVGPLACGGVVVGHVAGDAFLQCGGLQRVYFTPDFMGILLFCHYETAEIPTHWNFPFLPIITTL